MANLITDDNSFLFFVTRFLSSHKNLKISYTDLLNEVYTKMEIFDDNIIYTVHDYYEGYMILHSIVGTNINRTFEYNTHYIMVSDMDDMNIKNCYELLQTCNITTIDIAVYMFDNNLYDNCLFDTRMDFYNWCKNLHINRKNIIDKYSVFTEKNGKADIDTVGVGDILSNYKLLAQGSKEIATSIINIEQEFRIIMIYTMILLIVLCIVMTYILIKLYDINSCETERDMGFNFICNPTEHYIL